VKPGDTAHGLSVVEDRAPSIVGINGIGAGGNRRLSPMLRADD
jgi:hypothetical protein